MVNYVAINHYPNVFFSLVPGRQIGAQWPPQS